MLLEEDPRALDVLRGVNARAFERRDEAVGLGLVFQVLHMGLTLRQLLAFGEADASRIDAVVDAMRLGVLARIDQGRAGETGSAGNGESQRSRNNGLYDNSPLRCCRCGDDTMSAPGQRTRAG